jgi:glycosyltransferase involved in cell wall biosynthesis
MEISVIIPVFKHGAYLRRAAESALCQPNVAEILIIEDGSPDDSLAVANQLASETARIRVLRHPNGENRGAAESRNLGLRAAQSDWIAFLDGDDTYAQNRFGKTLEVIAQNPDADGVYETIGTHYEHPEAKPVHLARMKAALPPGADPELTGMIRAVAPESLLGALVCRQSGWIHLNGLTIHRRLLGRAGYFLPNLYLPEDAEWIQRLAFYGRLYPGELKRPVAFRTVHQENRVLARPNPKHISSQIEFGKASERLALQHPELPLHVRRALVGHRIANWSAGVLKLRQRRGFRFVLLGLRLLYALRHPTRWRLAL